ncbi:MAG: hypothetical protein JXM70_01875 [Pirellulales bacterium]|nr:hypothetical protein [Pirellulales bacterium]
MKWKYYPLKNDDLKAKEQIFENLSMGALEHTLTQKLMARFSNATGSMLLIAFESLDLDAEWLYKYATYGGGKELNQVSGAQPILWTDSPRWGLIEFADNWLNTSKDAFILCENWILKPKHLQVHQRESKTFCFGEEVYFFLKSEDAGRSEVIECALRESEQHWATGVCSTSVPMPEGNIPSEAFFDEIVANTKHIFTPALDGEGYLVWSPTNEKGAKLLCGKLPGTKTIEQTPQQKPWIY